MYINEVKRDNETLKKISEFQSSIENLVSTGKSCWIYLFIFYSLAALRALKTLFPNVLDIRR